MTAAPAFTCLWTRLSALSTRPWLRTDTAPEQSGRPGDWRVEVHLEDFVGIRELTTIVAAGDEQSARAAAVAWLEHLRSHGRTLDGEDDFCYVAAISTVLDGHWERVDSCFLAERHRPVRWLVHSRARCPNRDTTTSTSR